jgi:hypothetical protein
LFSSRPVRTCLSPPHARSRETPCPCASATGCILCFLKPFCPPALRFPPISSSALYQAFVMEPVALPRGISRVGNKFRADSTRIGPLRTTVAQAKKDLALLRRGLLLSVSHRTNERTKKKEREEKRREEDSAGYLAFFPNRFTLTSVLVAFTGIPRGEEG